MDGALTSSCSVRPFTSAYACDADHGNASASAMSSPKKALRIDCALRSITATKTVLSAQGSARSSWRKLLPLTIVDSSFELESSVTVTARTSQRQTIHAHVLRVVDLHLLNQQLEVSLPSSQLGDVGTLLRPELLVSLAQLSLDVVPR